MPQIQVLDQNTINQIAAGEVIDRPSSIVKELVENAIDAGSTAITVEIRDGGIGYIRITDNGCGIPAEEISTAFLRHSTSKIRTAEDLMKITSLGFRGEALSSIAAIAQVEVITKTKAALTGISFRIEGGETVAKEEIGCPDGTTFLIRNVFFNVPARKKFLKSAQTEGGYIAELVEKIAISHPEISFCFINAGTTKLYTSGSGRQKDVIYTVFGREITQNVLPVDVESYDIHVSGFLGKPVISRGNRTYENYYINGRYIKSRIIAKAIEDAYKSFMMQHRYPFTVLNITVPMEMVDVNVHPSKMEVRFKNEQLVYQCIYDMLKAVLSGREFIPDVELVRREEEPQAPKSVPEPFEQKRAEFDIREFGKLGGDAKKPHSGSSMPSGFPPFGGGFSAKSSSYSRPAHQSGASQNAGPAGHSAAAPVTYPEAHGKGDTLKEKEILPELPWSTPGEVRFEDVSSEAKQSLGREAVRPFFAQTMGGGKPASPDVSETGETRIHPENAPNAPAESPAAQNVPTAPAESPAAQNVPTASAEDGPAGETQIRDAAQMELFGEGLLSKEARKKHRLIGQLFDTYWLIQYEDRLFIMDQHAAHEKVLYERTLKRFETEQATSQLVSPPHIISVSVQEEAVLKKHQELFERFGYEWSYFGGREYAITAVPADVFGADVKDLFMEILAELCQVPDRSTPNLIRDRIATASCKAAVKGNHSMSAVEADALIEELMTLENPYACPHGRPTIISMSKYELEKKFKRIV